MQTSFVDTVCKRIDRLEERCGFEFDWLDAYAINHGHVADKKMMWKLAWKDYAEEEGLPTCHSCDVEHACGWVMMRCTDCARSFCSHYFTKWFVYYH